MTKHLLSQQGGMVCSSQVAFQDAHIHVVNDQSCVYVLTRIELVSSLHNRVKLEMQEPQRRQRIQHLDVKFVHIRL